MHARVVLGVGKGARFKECPQFRSVLIRGSLQKNIQSSEVQNLQI